MWVWLGVRAEVLTVVKEDKKVVVEEDIVVEQNGLERSACWTVKEGCEMHSLV